MFLNTSGRVLYDGILFNSALTQEGGYLLDCDTSLAEKILKHLKMYKLRKKVKLQILPDYETWVVFDTEPFMSGMVTNVILLMLFTVLDNLKIVFSTNAQSRFASVV